MTETALTTALNMGFMSEMLSILRVVVGIALLLTGIGFVILALAVFGRKGRAGAPAPATQSELRPLASRRGKRSWHQTSDQQCADLRAQPGLGATAALGSDSFGS